MLNFFALFNLTPSFDVDSAALAETYQKLQKLTHPDKFATAGASEKLIAVQKNAQVNDAYQALKKPILRAEHILALRGIELNHEQQTMQDNVFLMQQMEWREQLEDIGSNPEQIESLEQLDDEIQGELSGQLQKLRLLLAENNSKADQQSADTLRKLKFLTKLRQEIELKEEALSDF
jgi:molecular chaperone HscB